MPIKYCSAYIIYKSANITDNTDQLQRLSCVRQNTSCFKFFYTDAVVFIIINDQRFQSVSTKQYC